MHRVGAVGGACRRRAAAPAGRPPASGASCAGRGAQRQLQVGGAAAAQVAQPVHDAVDPRIGRQRAEHHRAWTRTRRRPARRPGRIRCTSAEAVRTAAASSSPATEPGGVDQQHARPAGGPPAAGVQVLGPPVRLGAAGGERGVEVDVGAGGFPAGHHPAGARPVGVAGARRRPAAAGRPAPGRRPAAPGRTPAPRRRARRAAASGSRAARSATAAASSSPACGETASKSGLLRAELVAAGCGARRCERSSSLDAVAGPPTDPRRRSAARRVRGARPGPGARGGPGGPPAPGVRLFPAPHRPGARCRRRRPRPAGRRRRRG